MTPLHDTSLDEYARECVQIDRHDLQGEFMRVAADLAYWNEQYAVAYGAHTRSKLEAERIEAELRIAVRERLEDAGKKTTESMVDANVTRHKTYLAARAAQIDAEEAKVRLGGYLDAIRAKREMLISLGAMVRSEMRADPTILEPRPAPL